MSHWPSTKSRRVYSALIKIGWKPKTKKASSHKQMVHDEWGEATWAFHDGDEIGPKMMARIGKRFHLKPTDL